MDWGGGVQWYGCTPSFSTMQWWKQPGRFFWAPKEARGKAHGKGTQPLPFLSLVQSGSGATYPYTCPWVSWWRWQGRERRGGNMLWAQRTRSFFTDLRDLKEIPHCCLCGVVCCSGRCKRNRRRSPYCKAGHCSCTPLLENAGSAHVWNPVITRSVYKFSPIF